MSWCFQTLGLFLPFVSTGNKSISSMLEICSISIALQNLQIIFRGGVMDSHTNTLGKALL